MMDDTTEDMLYERFQEIVAAKTVDKEAAPGGDADDVETPTLNAAIQAGARMKFSARTAQGRFRAPRSKGK